MKRTARLILAAMLGATLAACGGANAGGASEPPTGGAADGYDKGAVHVRDVRSATGGTFGAVNTAHYTHTLTGLTELAFEWANLTVLDNNAERGENVASYAQANKHGTGPTWAAVSEASDTSGLSGALIAHEFNTWTSGPDNGQRIGLDVLSGDAKAIRGQAGAGQAHASTAIRIGQTTGTPWATWGTGIELRGNFRESALRLYSPAGVLVLEIKPNGDIYKNGIKVL